MADETDPKPDDFGEINDVIASIRALVQAEAADTGDGDAPRKFNTLQLTSGDRLSEAEAQAALENARAIVAAQVRRDGPGGAAPLWQDVNAPAEAPSPSPEATAPAHVPSADGISGPPRARSSSRFAAGTALNPHTPQTGGAAGRLPKALPAFRSAPSQAGAGIDMAALALIIREIVREELARVSHLPHQTKQTPPRPRRKSPVPKRAP